MIPTDEQIVEMAKVLALTNGFAWDQLWHGGTGANLSSAVASKLFYIRLARAALMHVALSQSSAKAV